MTPKPKTPPPGKQPYAKDVKGATLLGWEDDKGKEPTPKKGGKK